MKAKEQEVSKEGFWQRARAKFRKNRLGMIAYRFIGLLALIALLADFLAEEKPIVASYEGTTYFPVLRQYAVDLEFTGWPEPIRNAQWAELEYDWAVWPLVPYLPRNPDLKNAHYKGPFDVQNVPSIGWRHWLGTDRLGHDVLASLIHGTRIALLVGLVAMGIAALIGVLLGSLAGYFGDARLRLTRAQVICNVLGLFFGCFYAFAVRGYTLPMRWAPRCGALLGTCC